MESDQAELTMEILDQSGAIFNPVTAIHVQHAVDAADFRAVDVAANHPCHAGFARILDHGFFVIRHVLHGRLGSKFDKGGERPVAEAQHAADAVDPRVQIEDSFVQGRAHAIQETVEVGQSIELMAVNDEVAPTVGCSVNGAFDQPDCAESDANVLFQKFIMVSRDKRDARFFAVLSEQLLNQYIVFVSPAPLSSQLPAVNEVADYIQVGTFVLSQKIQERAHLGVFGAQMQIRNPYRAVVHQPFFTA